MLNMKLPPGAGYLGTKFAYQHHYIETDKKTERKRGRENMRLCLDAGTSVYSELL